VVDAGQTRFIAPRKNNIPSTDGVDQQLAFGNKVHASRRNIIGLLGTEVTEIFLQVGFVQPPSTGRGGTEAYAKQARQKQP
jgi:hypothetical protein